MVAIVEILPRKKHLFSIHLVYSQLMVKQTVLGAVQRPILLMFFHP